MSLFMFDLQNEALPLSFKTYLHQRNAINHIAQYIPDNTTSYKKKDHEQTFQLNCRDIILRTFGMALALQYEKLHTDINLSHCYVNTIKMPSKLIRILRITFCYKQLCGRCLVHMTPVVKVVIHCVFALL